MFMIRSVLIRMQVELGQFRSTLKEISPLRAIQRLDNQVTAKL